jgi:hypothetical protein
VNGGVFLEVVVGGDGGVFDDERVGVCDGLVLGDVVEHEGNAVGALIEDGVGVEQSGVD